MRLTCWESVFVSSAIAIGFGVDMPQVSAQTVSPADLIPTTPPLIPVNPASQNLLLPPSEELLKPSNPKPTELYPQLNPPSSTDTSTDTFIVREFQIVGSTVFSTEELAATVKSFTDRPLTFTDLLQVRSAIADLYIRNGYITSGAFIPPQETNNGVVSIQVIEGKLEDIQITGMNRLDPNYVESRLSQATAAPLNRDRLINALQLLQVDPLFSFVSAELKAGSQLGTNILAVKVEEANSFNAQIGINNSAPVSVGQLQRQIEISDRNLLGFGDKITANYGNTDGRNQYNFNYTIPINPDSGTVSLSFSNTNSNIVEPEFKSLDIYANSTTYEFSFRQPIMRTPAQELALGLTAAHSDSFTTLLKLPIPLSLGADDLGRTKLSILRFFQDYSQRSTEDVLSLRSQLSLGLGGVLNSTENVKSPDSNFVAWRGQMQYIRSLAEDTLLLVNGSLQFADRPLPAAERFSLGGALNGRGYRQDAIIGDNGFNLSLEARFPILRMPEVEGLLQVAPFVDLGSVWNHDSSATLTNNWLIGTGLGLRWQMGNRLTARLDYGFPLISMSSNRQENTMYFSLSYNLF